MTPSDPTHTRRLVPLVPAVLGAVILVAEAADGRLAGGIAWFAVLAGIVYELARGHDPSPYIELMALGGATYAVALLVLRRRS